MAGEVEDPIGFQSECLPTGSISFGKFESEALSWERRSSFSHNRYLEEVEKFSTPGSVTQKKAYFEAHFKKRGLFRQASSASQSSGEGRAPECEGEDQVNCTDLDGNSCLEEEERKAWEDRHNGGDGYDESHCLEDAKCYEVQYEENGQAQARVPWYDDKLVVAEEDAARESGNGVEVDSVTGTSDSQVPIAVKEIPESRLQTPSFAEPDQTNSGCDISSVTVDNQVAVEHESLTISDEVHLVKVEVQKQDPHGISHGKATTRASVKRTVKSETKNQPSNSKRLQRPSTEVHSVKTPSRSEANGLRRKKPDRQPLFMSSATPTISRSMKSEDPKNSKVKRISLSRSENDLKIKKGGITTQSTFGKTASLMASTPSRPTRMISSAKPELRTSCIAGESKSSNTGGMRIKEVMAKMKEFRKSLDFKATPMPSFYREAVPKAPTAKTPARPVKPAQASAGRRDAPHDRLTRPASRNTKAPSTVNSSNTPRAVSATKEAATPRRGTGIGGNSARSKKDERSNATSNTRPS